MKRNLVFLFLIVFLLVALLLHAAGKSKKPFNADGYKNDLTKTEAIKDFQLIPNVMLF